MQPSLYPLPAPTYRACEVCDHGRHLRADGQRVCACPELSYAKDKSVEVLRSSSGACGPEAVYLDFPGLHLRRRAA